MARKGQAAFGELIRVRKNVLIQAASAKGRQPIAEALVGEE
jgi:hypothetical protein